MQEVLTDIDYQHRILPEVSRTFALTIPQLPAELSPVVGNAYLLCRIADTIEDDAELDITAKTRLLDEFIQVLRHERSPEEFAAEAAAMLASVTPATEIELMANAARVVNVTFSFSATQQAALLRCVQIMSSGMPEFQNGSSLQGLKETRDLSRYCYFVAGVVGEMLTDLFCEYSPELHGQSEARREQMMSLAVSFGQGLQMTNILKDIWQDRDRGACWLPRDRFGYMDRTLTEALEARDAGQLAAGIDELVGIAHYHLRRALEYTCMIPRREVGVRKFCLWAIALAVLTLRNIYRNPGFTDGGQVKVSRPTVKATILICNASLYSNAMLKSLFAIAARGLPLPNSAIGDLTAADVAMAAAEPLKERAQPCIDPAQKLTT